MTSILTHRAAQLTLALALAAVTTHPLHAQATPTRETETIPFLVVVTACNGEDILLEGELAVSEQTIIDPTGRIHFQSTLVPSHVGGVGLSTGAFYKAVGGERTHFDGEADEAPLSFTFTSMFNLISNGSTDNLQVQIIFHVTVDEDGNVTVLIDQVSQVCLG